MDIPDSDRMSYLVVVGGGPCGRRVRDVLTGMAATAEEVAWVWEASRAAVSPGVDILLIREGVEDLRDIAESDSFRSPIRDVDSPEEENNRNILDKYDDYIASYWIL